MDTDAKAYSDLNKPQYDIGCEFVRFLNISEGDKVLDMGCGTGDVTNYIASLVGQHGEVVGVDPDEGRVKIAQEKFKDVQNLKFVVGDSSSAFPHDNEEYYDLHFSSGVFHWLFGKDKKDYIEKAHQCLKPGGRIAFMCLYQSDQTPSALIAPKGSPLEVLTLDKYKQLFDDVALFTNVTAKTLSTVSRFPSSQGFEAWFKATTHRDIKEFDPNWVKNILAKFTRTEADGTFLMELDIQLRITAEKSR